MSIAGKTAIIGAGLVGIGWAIVFARAGHDVAIYDSVPGAAERALATIAARLDDLAQADLLVDAPSVLSRIRPAATLAPAPRGRPWTQSPLTSSTIVRQGGANVAAGQLHVGMTVAVLVATADATAAVTVVVVPPVDLGALGAVGTLTAVSATAITIADPAGAATTYALTPTTRVQVGPALVSTESLVTGQLVHVETTSATPTVASAVHLEPAHMEGVVTAVSGEAITLGDDQGFERTVLVSPATTYRDARGVTSLDSVRVGSSIVATGVVDGDHTSLDAVAVDVGSVARGALHRRRGAATSPTGSRGWARRSGRSPHSP